MIKNNDRKMTKYHKQTILVMINDMCIAEIKLML